MHIILGILGTIVTILVLVNRLNNSGIDLGWLNPFSWAHRRRWRKKYHADPAFSITSPMESAAGLMYVAAKLSGEMTREEKAFLINTFETKFNLTNQQATDLLSSCSFIIKDEDEILNKLDKYLEPSKEDYSPEQINSTLELIDSVIKLNDAPSEKQKMLLNRLTNSFRRSEQNPSWN